MITTTSQLSDSNINEEIEELITINKSVLNENTILKDQTYILKLEHEGVLFKVKDLEEKLEERNKDIKVLENKNEKLINENQEMFKVLNERIEKLTEENEKLLKKLDSNTNSSKLYNNNHNNNNFNKLENDFFKNQFEEPFKKIIEDEENKHYKFQNNTQNDKINLNNIELNKESNTNQKNNINNNQNYQLFDYNNEDIKPKQQIINETPNQLDKPNDSQVEIISMNGTSDRFWYCGTHNYWDLQSIDLRTGICVKSPYIICLELNSEHEFDQIQVGGCKSFTGFWPAFLGAKAEIYTSKDKTNWTGVGSLPHDFGSKISTVSLKKTTAKFIKFQHDYYLGIGYLKIIKS